MFVCVSSCHMGCSLFLVLFCLRPRLLHVLCAVFGCVFACVLNCLMRCYFSCACGKRKKCTTDEISRNNEILKEMPVACSIFCKIASSNARLPTKSFIKHTRRQRSSCFHHMQWACLSCCDPVPPKQYRVNDVVGVQVVVCAYGVVAK